MLQAVLRSSAGATSQEFEQGLVETIELLWKNYYKGTLLCRRQEGVPLGTLITSLPSWPMSTLPTTFCLSISPSPPFSFALEITLYTISYGWTLLIHLHACEPLSTHFVFRIFQSEFPFLQLIAVVSHPLIVHEEGSGSVLPRTLPQVMKDFN